MNGTQRHRLATTSWMRGRGGDATSPSGKPPTSVRSAPASSPQPLGRSAAATRLVGSLLVLAVASACSSGPAGGHLQVQASVPALASPSIDPLQVPGNALVTYRAFWAALIPVSRLPAGQRHSQLSVVAADPELSSLLRGMAAADRKGQAFYGRDLPSPKLVGHPGPNQSTVIDDCMDSRQSGLLDLKSGRKLTAGVARNHVVTTLHQPPDGGWRVVFVSHTSSPC